MPGVLDAPQVQTVLASSPASVPAIGEMPAEPMVVVVGAPRSGRSSVVGALLDAPGLAVAAQADTAWLVFRPADQPSARAYVPGHREPRPIPLDAGPAAAKVGPSRPPRRIEVGHPAALLTEVALVDTPSLAPAIGVGRPGDLDAATVEVALDIVARSAGMVFVVDATTPLGRPQLDILGTVAGRARHVAFVFTRIDQNDRWPAVLTANQAALHRYGPRLAQAPWFPVALPAVPARFHTARRGGSRLAELRRLLTGWAADTCRPADPAGTPPATPAPAVTTADDRWRDLLDREIRARRIAAGQSVAIDLATAHVRCVQELGAGRGCAEFAHVLDRELHALSIRTTRRLAEDVAATIRLVFGALLHAPADDPALARVAAAARRTVDSLGLVPGCERDRALLLTATSAVASVSGPGALASLSATGLPEPSGPALAGTVLPPIAIGLTASCFQLWQQRVDRNDCRRWLQQALRVIEAELDRELAQRFGDLHQALAIIAADAVDHGVLLT